MEHGDAVEVIADRLDPAKRGELGDRIRQKGTVSGMTAGGAQVMVKFDNGRGVMLKANQVKKVAGR